MVVPISREGKQIESTSPYNKNIRCHIKEREKFTEIIFMYLKKRERERERVIRKFIENIYASCVSSLF